MNEKCKKRKKEKWTLNKNPVKLCRISSKA